MGEGKTEAAFFAHLELQRNLGHRGLYVALPTKATGNAMFKRTLKFLRGQGMNRPLDLQLMHGGTLLNDTFQGLRFSGIHDPAAGGEVRAGEWFTNKKRALLSEYGVGTVDQALLPILPVRHNFVRLWGLANRVVVFDETDSIIKADGTQAKDGVVSDRYYLADAAFLVGLESKDRTLLEQAHAALRDPFWPLALGRKSYVPSEPIFIEDGIQDAPLEKALSSWCWISRLRKWEQSPEKLRVSWESQDGSGALRMDQPLSSFAERRFGARFIHSEWIPFPKEAANVPA